MVGATFLDFLWTMIIIFFMVAFFMILFQVIGDLFRRDDISGAKKVLWIIFLVLAVFLGVFIYLIVNGNGMRERQMAQMKESQQQFDSYVRETAGSGGSADEIAKAKGLLDAGTITQAEFDAIKAKALA
jgi:type VI protein secretion system component VasK